MRICPAPREEVFQLMGRKMGLFSVNSSVVQKQSPFSLGRNSMGLSGNQRHSAQKVTSPSGSLFFFCQQEKYSKISPKELCSPVLPSKYKKEEITSMRGVANHCGGDGKSPCPAHGSHIPFAPDSFVINRAWLIKRGRNNGNILFPPQGRVQRWPHLWRPCQHQLSRCGCLMRDFLRGNSVSGCPSCTSGAVTGQSLPAPVIVNSPSAPLSYRNVLSSLILGEDIWRAMSEHVNQHISCQSACQSARQTAIRAMSTQRFLTFMTSSHHSILLL